LAVGSPAAEQPDAADEVGALQGRPAPPSQLIRVFDGREIPVTGWRNRKGYYGRRMF